jgi:hypothetical protein
VVLITNGEETCEAIPRPPFEVVRDGQVVARGVVNGESLRLEPRIVAAPHCSTYHPVD